MKKVVIFDMDGTLLDTLPYTIDVLNHSLAVLGYPAPKASMYKTLLGASLDTMAEHLLHGAGARGTEQEIQRFSRQVYQCQHTPGRFRPVKAFEGVIPLLEQLTNWGIQTAVLSNTPHPLVRSFCTEYLPPKFDCIYGEGEVPKKPSPQGVLRILSELGSCREHCILVGDSMTDILTARAAGIDFLGVAWGCLDREELLEAGSTSAALSCKELIETIGDRFR